jgi:acylphosphatase
MSWRNDRACRRGPLSARRVVTEETAGSDALNLRPPGERFSVLPTI